MKVNDKIKFNIRFVILIFLFIFLSLIGNVIWSVGSLDAFYNTYKFYFLDFNKISEFGSSLFYSIIYTITTLVLQMLIALISAYHTYFSSRRNLLIIIYFLSYCSPVFLTALISRLPFDSNGFITNFLNLFFSENFYPLSSEWFSFFLLVAISVIQYFPFAYLLLITIMLKVNKTIIYSAINDGADNRKIFKLILLPYLKKAIFPIIALRFLFMLNKFDLVFMFAESDRPSIQALFFIPLNLNKLFYSRPDVTLILVLIIVFFSFLCLILLQKTFEKYA